MSGAARRGRAVSPWPRRIVQGLLVLLASCGGESDDEPFDLERCVFVPAGRCVVRPERERVKCVLAKPLLVSRYEVTRSEWLQWEREQSPSSQAGEDFRRGWLDDSTEPASGMTLAEAREFAAWRGMRLPTAIEWIYLAAGPRAGEWPWGANPRESVANTATLGLFRTVPVGSFESGRSPGGLYDMLGNVWEWVEAPLPYSLELRQDRIVLEPSFTWRDERLAAGIGLDRVWLLVPRFPTHERESRILRVQPWSALYEPGRRSEIGIEAESYAYDQAWAMGGSYLYPELPLHGRDSRGALYFLAQGRMPEHRSVDVGLRLVADAAQYLSEHAHEWERAEFRERLIRLGASPGWGRAALPLLEELSSRPGASRSLGWLLEGARR